MDKKHKKQYSGSFVIGIAKQKKKQNNPTPLLER